MNDSSIRNALLECREIEDVLCFADKDYQGKKYDILVKCKIVIGTERVPIIIGINDDWPINLFDFYIYYGIDTEDIKYRFIPHVDTRGKMCLWRTDNILIDMQFEGLLQECVKKAAQIIKEGTTGKNTEDFLSEFHAYWRGLQNVLFARVVMPSSEESVVLKWGKMNSVVEKHQLIVAQSSDEIEDWCNYNGPLRNAAVFFIDATNSAIFPPNPTQPNLVSFINKLLSFVEYRTRRRVFRKLKPPYVLIFHVNQPHGYWADIGFRLNVKANSIRGILNKCCQEPCKVEPIIVTRLDREYLMQRIAQQVRPLESLEFLLIGAGSIGAYFADFLGKAGGKNVTVVDDDILREENIFRHLLGKKFVDKPKTGAICEYMKSSLPGVNYRAVVKKVEDAYRNQDISLKNYDVIIAATGNENINRWLERKLVESSAKCKVIYVWNEPLDIGCHATCVDMILPGRYGDLFHHDENNMLINMSAFAAPNQEFERQHAGCDGSFIPYGSEVSIQAVLLGMDLLKKSVSGILKANVISSYKGDGLFFRKAGYEVSKCYEVQKEKVQVVNLERYRG